MKKHGFTLLEIIIVGIFAGLLVIFFFIQQSNTAAVDRDDQRKIAINAMYYSLEEDFYAKNGYYPDTISEDNLKSLDPELFTDPSGIVLGNSECSYSYTPANCDEDGHCKEYTLRAELEREEAYVKKSRN